MGECRFSLVDKSIISPHAFTDVTELAADKLLIDQESFGSTGRLSSHHSSTSKGYKLASIGLDQPSIT